MAAARRSIVVADDSKLGRVAFSTVAPLSAIDVLVTDAPASHQSVMEIAMAGVDVVHAKVLGG
jgi:DeoR/GlpR family transcriptional regulator of sugar metabolism